MYVYACMHFYMYTHTHTLSLTHTHTHTHAHHHSCQTGASPAGIRYPMCSPLSRLLVALDLLLAALGRPPHLPVHEAARKSVFRAASTLSSFCALDLKACVLTLKTTDAHTHTHTHTHMHAYIYAG